MEESAWQSRKWRMSWQNSGKEQNKRENCRNKNNIQDRIDTVENIGDRKEIESDEMEIKICYKKIIKIT